MKVSIFQGPELSQNVDQNIEALSVHAKQAADQGASLLIMPEMFLTGYNLDPNTVSELAEYADGKSAQRIAEIARKTSIGLLYGYPEADAGKVYNSAQMIDSNGVRLANYRKTHLFGDIDRNAFSAGESNVIFNFNGWRMGILICYDIEFPENLRQLALKGADFVVVPTALMKPYEFVPLKMVPTRAFENQLYIAYANRCGVESELEYYGLSCIVGPDGLDKVRADTHEQLVFADLNHDLLKESRQLNAYLTDRRPDLYSTLSI